MSDELFVDICVIILVIYSTSLHEMAHAFSANYFGDPTPGRYGRLTFNPLPHLSPKLTAIVLPAIFYLTGHRLFCMASTPVNPGRMRWPLRMMALVALSGPAMNFLCAAVMIGILWIPRVWRYPPNDPTFDMLILKEAAGWELILGVFNMLPLPPLDGYTVIRGLLPLGLRQHGDALARSQISMFVALILGSYLIGYVIDPLNENYMRLLPH